MMGKYLNGYRAVATAVLRAAGLERVGRRRQRLPGVQLQPQRERHGRLIRPPSRADYLTDVLAGKGVGFINRGRRRGQPVPARARDVRAARPVHAGAARRERTSRACRRRARRPSTRRTSTRRAGWPARPPLTPRQIAKIERPVPQARPGGAGGRRHDRPDRGDAARATASRDNTYIVFSSDNGYHMGDHRLLPGKMTAFDTDIRVPLVVAGPGVPAGRTVTRADREHRPAPDVRAARRRPTSRPASTATASSPLLARGRRRRLADAALVEHHGRDRGSRRPRLPAAAERQPDHVRGDAHAGCRLRRVQERRARVLRPARDPFELDNTYADLGPGRQARLHDTLTKLEGCSGQDCWVTAGGG